MKIILSPAKKMITDTDSIAPDGLPESIEKTTEIDVYKRQLWNRLIFTGRNRISDSSST